ncbi:hypothetical protein ACLOJK_020071 [Asimina triloba]
MLKSRRRPRIGGAHLCAGIAALLLLLSLVVLHNRLGSFRLSLGFFPSDHSLRFPDRQPHSRSSDASDSTNAAVHLLTDEDDDPNDRDDPIDVLDRPDEEAQAADEEEERILRAVGFDEDDQDRGEDLANQRKSGVFWDHAMGVTRRRGSLDRRSTGAVERWDAEQVGFFQAGDGDRSKVAFSSDDQPLDEGVRAKLDAIKSVEDALLLKANHGSGSSVLRDGWAPWFEKKGDFFRRDRMFRSNLEVLNPLNNPMLQDPDTPGFTVLTKSDKIIQKAMWREIPKTPFLGSQPVRSASVKATQNGNVGMNEAVAKKRLLEGRTLDETAAANQQNEVVGSGNVNGDSSEISGEKTMERIASDTTAVDRANQKSLESKDLPTHFREREEHSSSGKELNLVGKSEREHLYADGKRWGYFPGLDSNLSFLEFMDLFFKRGNCSMRVFMVWNSPPWMYGVRHQRGMESLLHHDRDVCVVVFSETLELDFFSRFVKDGFKIAVVMPNLDELLKDTPTHVFTSVWHKWKKIRFYNIHYSELVRLAAVYKYGGIYLDSDIIVLKSLHSLRNSIAKEERPEAHSNLNGAVMAFEKHRITPQHLVKGA